MFVLRYGHFNYPFDMFSFENSFIADNKAVLFYDGIT